MAERRPSIALGVAVTVPARFAALALLAWSASCSVTSFAADLYKCADKGRTTYQDYPCGASGTAFHTWPADQHTTAEPESLSRLKTRVSEMEQARRARETQFAIEGVERELRGYDQAEEDELAPLLARQTYANNNLSGAAWERAEVRDGIAREMQAVKDKYAARRQAARDRITLLREDARKDRPQRGAQ